MTVAANSYGTAAQVAAIVPRYSNGSAFSDSTRPTLGQVETWINQLSAILNAYLSEYGFSIPVTDADAVLALQFFVTEEVAAMAEGVNGSGKFGPTTKQGGGKGRFSIMMEDARAFVAGNAVGFERLGATRAYSQTSGLAYRNVDERGNETFPIFQRDAFNNKFVNTDSDGTS